MHFGERLEAQGSRIRAWGMEHREKPQIRNCPADSHPSGGFPVSQSAIRKLNSWLLTPYVCLAPYAVYLVPAALAAYAAKVAVDPTQLIAKVSPSS